MLVRSDDSSFRWSVGLVAVAGGLLALIAVGGSAGNDDHSAPDGPQTSWVDGRIGKDDSFAGQNRGETVSLSVNASSVQRVDASAQGHDDERRPMMQRGETLPRPLDSGLVADRGVALGAEFSHIISTEGARWTRLYFDEVTLEGDSTIRITSLLDGAVQQLDARGFEMWSNTSAYFNGDAVLIELIPGAGTVNNRFVLNSVHVEFVGAELSSHCQPPLQCGICNQDDRVESNENWAPRLLLASGGGCSAAMINPQGCVVSAGHCMSSSMTLQFNVPKSDPDCTLNHPPVEDQFPIISFLSQNGGVGADWAVLLSGTNNLGQLPYDRYGEYRPIASSIPSSGLAEVWGYGVSDDCTLGQSQQYSSGAIVDLTSDSIRYHADVTCGNSGSSLLHKDEIIGVVTHCTWDCPPEGNIATRVDVFAFANALNQLCPEPIANDICENAVVVGDGDTPFTTLGATTTGPDEPNHCNFGGDSNIHLDAWFEYTATCTGDVTFSLCGSEQPPPVGQCDGNCSGQAPSGCWCDSSCDFFTDCCADVCLDCPNHPFCGAAGECAGNCGGQAPTGCWCDDACDGLGDCCANVCDDCPNLTHCTSAGSGFDTKIAVYGSQCPTAPGAVIACNKDACGSLSEITVPAFVGQTFKVRIGGHDGDQGGGVLNISCEPGPGPACPADLDGNGVVNVFDLLELLAQWGPCPQPPAPCPADLDNNTVVNVFDLLELLAAWGPCSP